MSNDTQRAMVKARIAELTKKRERTEAELRDIKERIAALESQLEPA